MNIGVVGEKGESMVARFLQKQGFAIIKRNYQCRYGEIDIIAQNDRYILFVEVKTRSDHTTVRRYEYVNLSKQRKIFITADIYLRNNGFGLQPRFDVAEVLVSKTGEMSLNYIENAFGADSYKSFRSSL